MKVAYFSPFNPVKSGISDFAEELLPELKKHVDIDIFTDGYRPTNKEIINNFGIFDIKDIYEDKIRDSYDLLVYQVGNNSKAHSGIVNVLCNFPGICELHDVSLHHFVAEETYARGKCDEYIEIMKYCHGSKGEKRARDFVEGYASPPWECESMTYTVSKHIIDKAKAVIVHSDLAKQMIRGVNPKVPVFVIPHHTNDIFDNYKAYKRECREKLSIDQNKIVFASFGFASKNKRILQILDALALYKKRFGDTFLYMIVGKVQEECIKSKIKETGLEKNTIITGFTELDDFKCYMGACDIALNLRYPTQGESSGSLHRLLGMGKPVMVTDIGSFQEYPDDVVIKISYGDNEVSEIYHSLCNLVKNKEVREECERKSLEFAKVNCDLKTNVQKYLKFFKQVVSNSFEFNSIDLLIDTLFELGLTDDSYIDHLLNKMSYL